MAKIQGKTVTVGGVDYVFAPLPLGPLAEFQDVLEKFKAGKVGNTEHSRGIIAAAFASLRRNYPDMTIETVGNEIVDVSNMSEIMGAMMASSLVEKTGPGEEKAV